MLLWVLVAAGSLTGAAGGVPANHSATAARQAPDVVLRNLRFVGMESDVVGTGFRLPGTRPRNPKPNGDRDGHFSVTLSTPAGARTLLQVALVRQTPKPGDPKAPPGPPDWRSAPATSPPIGVVLNGKRLNPNDEKLAAPLPRSSKGVRLDVYVNDDGQFLPGRRFRVVVQTTARGRQVKVGTESTWLTIPGAAATMTASFAGRGEDRIGTFAFPSPIQPNAPAPDGFPDAHFTGVLDTHKAWRIMTHVVLQHIDAQGRGIGKPGGYCRPGPDKEIAANGWNAGCLLVLVDGRVVALSPAWGEGPEGPEFDPKLKPWPRCPPRGDPPPRKDGSAGACMIYAPLRPSARPVRLDVYANDPDPALAVSGQRFRLTVYFSDYGLGAIYGPAGTASAIVRIG
jgi:hypothetical protein